MPILYTKARPSGNRIPVNWWSGTGSPYYSNLGDELTPNEPLINVVNDFSWTLTPTNSLARKEAPFIILREFLQLDTQLNQCLLPYGREPIINPLPEFRTGAAFAGIGDVVATLGGILEGISLEPNQLYKGLFDHYTPTNFIYKLPFFTEEYFSIQNNWSGVDVIDTLLKLQSQGLGLGRGLFNMISRHTQSEPDDNRSSQQDALLQLPYALRQFELFNLKMNSPTVGLMDPPHVWKQTNNRQYTFSFPLYNVDISNATKPEDLIVKNWEFCYLLTYQNLINKGNFFTAIPPVFYEVTIPGVHYCKASYMSDIVIENIGNIRLMKLPINGNSKVDVNIPDGYLITITLTDLLMPSKNLLYATVNTETRQKIQQGVI